MDIEKLFKNMSNLDNAMSKMDKASQDLSVDPFKIEQVNAALRADEAEEKQAALLIEANRIAESALEDAKSARFDADAARRAANLANIIAVIAMAIAAKDEILSMLTLISQYFNYYT